MSVLVGTGNKIWSGLYVIIPSIGLVICVGLLDIFYINPYSVSYWWYLGLLFVFCMVATVLVFGGFVAGLWYVLEERNSDTNDSGEDGNYINVSRLKEPVPYKELLCQENIDIQYGRRPCFKGTQHSYLVNFSPHTHSQTHMYYKGKSCMLRVCLISKKLRRKI